MSRIIEWVVTETPLKCLWPSGIVLLDVENVHCGQCAHRGAYAYGMHMYILYRQLCVFSRNSFLVLDDPIFAGHFSTTRKGGPSRAIHRLVPVSSPLVGRLSGVTKV